MKLSFLDGTLRLLTHTSMMTHARHSLLPMLAVMVILLSGCMKFGSSQPTKTPPETTMQKEVAEIVKMYRLCLQKYEDTPGTAKEHCGAYRDALRDLAPDTQKSLVTELLDRLRDKIHEASAPR